MKLMDTTTAYLCGDMAVAAYMEQPEGFNNGTDPLMWYDGLLAKSKDRLAIALKWEQQVKAASSLPGTNFYDLKSQFIQVFVQAVLIKFLSQLKDEKFHSILEEIAFNFGACNFGAWETKISKDRLALECHAHGHLVLTDEGQRRFAALSCYGDVLAGRHAPPFPYDLEDAADLESKLDSKSIGLSNRLSGHRLSVLESTMKNMESNLEEFKSNVDAKFQLLDSKFQQSD
ncbi:hypothetical protein HK101_002245 [Irineochytrium annulatum]|nr:hypothetical protein HK101_002245 [Irineochytrium annulatum]